MCTRHGMVKYMQEKEKAGTDMKKIVAINAGPRKGYNTDTLVRKAADGAAAAGAEIIWFDLYRLENPDSSPSSQ